MRPGIVWRAGAALMAAFLVVGGQPAAAGHLPTLPVGPSQSPVVPSSPARSAWGFGDLAPTTRPLSAACTPHPDLVKRPEQAAPRELVDALRARTADPRFAGLRLGASVWVEGYGEVVAENPDLPLLPASNQKLLTAIGALSLLDPAASLSTEVRVSGAIQGGTLWGDLVLVGGGDPTLEARGPHSLETLALGVKEAGVTKVEGDLLVDESRYDAVRTAEGWLHWQVPAYVGPLSALTVDGNQHRDDPGFLADPGMGNGELFSEALAGAGVEVKGGIVVDRSAPGARTITSLPSPPVGELVDRMLLRSDNTVAELLVKEIGLAAAGLGTTEAGLAATTGAIGRLCLSLGGWAADGSGLSRGNRRSTREWRMILQAAQGAVWWDTLSRSLPVAGRNGTLAGRFRGTPAAGTLRAKTGSIVVGRALSGFGTTEGGRRLFFSVVTNGVDPAASLGAIDELLVEVVSHDR